METVLQDIWGSRAGRMGWFRVSTQQPEGQLCWDPGLQGRGRAVNGRAGLPIIHMPGQRVGAIEAFTQSVGVPSGNLEVQPGSLAMVTQVNSVSGRQCLQAGTCESRTNPEFSSSQDDKENASKHIQGH